jgi:ATP-dependent helicase/DNAse subunit B
LQRGALTSGTVLESLGERDAFSATEVESYLQCPYRWFYERVLRPQDIDCEFDGRELGSRAHGFLSEFYSRLPSELGVKRVTRPVLAASLELFDRVATEAGASMTPTASLDEELAADRALAWSRQVVVDDAEMFLGADRIQPEAQFEGVPFAGGHFKGRIDRIDVGPDAAFVTDYKASTTVHGFANFESEGLVQSVLYAVAVETDSALPVAASVYRSLRARRCRGFWRADLLSTPPVRCSERDALGEREFGELVAQTEERVATALAGMKAGLVPRSPRANACAFCSIASLCDGGAP